MALCLHRSGQITLSVLLFTLNAPWVLATEVRPEASKLSRYSEVRSAQIQDARPAWQRQMEEGERTAIAKCVHQKDCADQREYSSLRAQWVSTEAAIRQAELAKYQTILGVFGTLGVLLALMYSARATRASVKANTINAAAIFAANRPIVVSPRVLWKVRRDSSKIIGYDFAVEWKNIGKYPAEQCTIRTQTKPFPSGISADDILFHDPEIDKSPRATLWADIPVSNEYRFVSMSELHRAYKSEIIIILWSRVDYDINIPGVGNDLNTRRHSELYFQISFKCLPEIVTRQDDVNFLPIGSLSKAT
jgi:hypothetical protein